MASVTFKRGTRAEIEATAKQDGQILMETDQNKKNKMYIDLPDGSRVLIGNSGEAIDTSYDNTTSGLDATNVQNAIDKIESNVGDISGITDSLTATSSNIALSAAGGNNLQGQIDTLNSNLNKQNNRKTLLQGGYATPLSQIDVLNLSDYRWLSFCLVWDNAQIFDVKTITYKDFVDIARGGVIYLYNGKGDVTIEIRYVDDTHLKINCSNSYATLRIYGNEFVK